jgi:outer membrane protein TolC
VRSRDLIAAGLWVLAVCVPSGAGAQVAPPAIDFEAAIAQALAKNPTVASAATSIVQAEALLQQARTVFRPAVSAGLTNTTIDSERGFSGGVSQPQNQFTFSGNVSMTVLAPAQWAAANQARDQIDVARVQTDEVRQQVAVATAQAYLAVIAQKRLVAVTARSLESARAHLKYAQDRLAAGLGSRLNELRASQTVSSDEVRLENAHLGLRRAQEALGVLIAADGPVDAGGEPALDVAGAIREAGLDQDPNATAWMSARPDVRRQTSQIEAARVACRTAGGRGCHDAGVDVAADQSARRCACGSGGGGQRAACTGGGDPSRAGSQRSPAHHHHRL